MNILEYFQIWIKFSKRKSHKKIKIIKKTQNPLASIKRVYFINTKMSVK